jgi:hypothetical protein
VDVIEPFASSDYMHDETLLIHAITPDKKCYSCKFKN